MEQRIGFVGLGTMGRWMVRNLLRAGFPLTVLDIELREGAKLASLGATEARNPAQLAACSDWIFLSLPDAQVVEEVLFGVG